MSSFYENPPNVSKIIPQWLGQIPYLKFIEQQEKQTLRLQNRQGAAGVIWGMEHPAVITMGRRASTAELKNKESLLPIPVVETERGGLATLHSEGQIVIYPIFSLRERAMGVREYVELLASVTVNTLARYSIVAFYKQDDPGIYTEQGKLGFIGIRIKNGISNHGISLNFKNDLQLFKWIRPCGLEERELCRFVDLGKLEEIEMSDFFRHWCDDFLETLTQRHQKLKTPLKRCF